MKSLFNSLPGFNTPKMQEEEVQKPRSPETYERLLNPDRVLPGVILEPEDSFDPKRDELASFFFVKNTNGEKIGRVDISIPQKQIIPRGASAPNFVVDRAKPAHLNDIDVYPEFKGKGYGRSTYLEIIKYLSGYGVRFRSARMFTRDAEKIWDWLVRQKVARIVGERDPSPGDISSTHYEVI